MTNIDTKIQHEILQNAQFDTAQNINVQHQNRHAAKSYDYDDTEAVLNDVGKDIAVTETSGEELSDFEDSSNVLKFKIVQESKETLQATANQEPHVVKELLTGVA